MSRTSLGLGGQVDPEDSGADGEWGRWKGVPGTGLTWRPTERTYDKRV